MVTWFYFIVFMLSLLLTGSFLIKNKKADSVFVLFALLVNINCMGRYFLAASETLEMALWSNKFMYVGGCYLPLLTVMVLTKLCDLRISKSILVVMGIYSTVVLAAVFSIGKSDLYYKQVEMGYGDGYNYLVKVYGPLHNLYPVMMFVYAVIMILYLVYAFKKKTKISFRLVLTISITAFSIFVMYIIERIVGTNISFLAIGYLISIVLMMGYFQRINRYDMSVNICSSVEKTNEYGYIVLDEKYRYMNANELIKSVFSEIEDWIVDEVIPVSDSYLYKEVIQYVRDWNGEENNYKVIQNKDSFFQLTIRNVSYGNKEKAGFLLEFIDRTLEMKYYKTVEEYNARMEQEVARKTEELNIQQNKIKELFMQTVTALSDAVDAKDRYTSGHSKRVAEYSRMIAARMGKSKDEQDKIYRAGLLHDVGKIRIPAEIINKPGKLTEEEYNVIKLHPLTGYHILRGISDDEYIAVASKYHHERYDGKGYPNGLAGEKIPEVARILGVADAYDAMASNRSYRNALPQELVRDEIEKGAGSQFDPGIAAIMLQLIDEDKEYVMRQTDDKRRQILAVDDESMNIKILTHIMRDEPNYEIVAAESGKEALEILEQQTFDLILLDVKMPEMDGFETLRHIRTKYRTPVVFMTGDKTLDISAELKEMECDDYITKPFIPLMIKEVVHNMTEGMEIL